MAAAPPLSQAMGYGVVVGLGFLFAYKVPQPKQPQKIAN